MTPVTDEFLQEIIKHAESRGGGTWVSPQHLQAMARELIERRRNDEHDDGSATGDYGMTVGQSIPAKITGNHTAPVYPIEADE